MSMSNDFLPEPLPENPMEIFGEWFADARARAAQPNPDAMVLATVGTDMKPSARVVLCKRLDPEGCAVFFTNYESRKGRELTGHPRAAAVMHWDVMHRQVRIEGTVVRSPTAESAEYFATRALASRVGAWASRQSQPLASRGALASQVDKFEKQFGVDLVSRSGHVPRPPHWGGFRLWIDTLELWVEGPGRIHDRAVWTRDLKKQDEFAFSASAWRSTRLNP
jgi:pyridoxamine 5'-phosphate oxidase